MESAARPPMLKFGPYLVDLAAGEVRKNGSRIRLQEKPMRVLALLAERQGELVTREELQKRLWPQDTFVDFEAGLNTAVGKLRDALSDSAENPRYIETIPRRGYRFLVPVEPQNGHHTSPDLPENNLSIPSARPGPAPATPVSTVSVLVSAVAKLPAVDAHEAPKTKSAKRTTVWISLAAAVVLVLLAQGYFYVHHKPILANKDTVVLTEFANTTGDVIFDDTLKTGLNVSLRQSPFLDVLSENDVARILRQMTRPVDTRLTPDVASELCQRAGGKAYVAGSIGRLGNEYVLGLKALNCQNGATLAQEQDTAANRENVLDALGKAATKLRGELGESLATVKSFDVPLSQATTASLEALKAYSLGIQTLHEKGTVAAVPFFRHAIELDPNFASAYLYLGKMYTNLGETNRARELFTTAFSLRDHASEREKFDIESLYFWKVTNDLESTTRVFGEWLGSYPRDHAALANLASVYASEGQYEQAVELARESAQQNPDDVMGRIDLAYDLMEVGRFPEARKVLDDAVDRHLDDESLHYLLYSLAFLAEDTRGMAEQVSWSESKPESIADFLSYQATVEAYSGHLRRSRELNRRAIESAERAGLKESAESWRLEGLLREAAVGKLREVQQTALSQQGPSGLSALVLAWVGNSSHAQSMLESLSSRFPQGTLVQSVVLPTVRAQIELSQKKPQRSIELLRAAAPYELTDAWLGGCIYPAYVRGEAYLSANQGAAAAAEFQKILDHRGLVVSCETGALAHVGIARAYTLQGDATKAKAAYKDFLALWKNADPDIPILKQAKSEYAKLQ